MPKKPYKDLIREAFHGNKFLETGEINPQYDKYWGLKYGRYYKQAKELLSYDKDLFLAKSTTQEPLEYAVMGMVWEKAQYQFRSIEQDIKQYNKEHNLELDDARTRAVDLARLQEFLSTYKKYGSAVIKDEKTGKEITVRNPNYYAKRYKEAKITREDFFEKIKQWQKGIDYIAQHKNNYD